MNNPLVYVPIVLVFGVVAGYLLHYTDSGSIVDANTTYGEVSVTPVNTQVGELSDDRIEALALQVERLSRRLDQLEAGQVMSNALSPETETALAPEQPAVAFTQDNLTEADGLVAAGIDRASAQDILQRRNEHSLAMLELRDRATREGYIGTDKYRKEVRELQSSQPTLRTELGDEYYDRYLYVSGQQNRVSVLSVIGGSAAEQSGIEPGDVILSYADQRLYSWRDLNSATTAGTRDEYVSLTVQRDGYEMQVNVPRGPLGVRLGTSRQNPDAG